MSAHCSASCLHCGVNLISLYDWKCSWPDMDVPAKSSRNFDGWGRGSISGADVTKSLVAACFLLLTVPSVADRGFGCRWELLGINLV